MAFLTHQRRVAIVGLPNSGKTVLITSLLMHLQNLSPAISDGVGTLNAFRPRHRSATVENELPEFPFDAYRRHLAEHGVFPNKTVTESEYSFDLEFAGKNYCIDLLDIPGERFYDVEMYQRNYAEWCDELERLWLREQHPAMQAYRGTVESDSCTDVSTVVAAYRELLANLIANFRTSITPSIFRLSRDGVSVRGRTAAAILESSARNPCGLTFEEQFAPLFRATREKHTELAATFERHYDSYVKTLVQPLFSELSQCDRLAILIDVPFILAAAEGAFEDQYHLIERALKSLVPDPSWSTWIGRTLREWSLSPWRRKVDKVAFIATKSDLVAASDTDRLAFLLSSLVMPQKSFLKGITAKEIVLSAVKSTENPGIADANDVGHLTGRLQFDYSATPPTRRSPTDPKVDYEVSRLPDAWPQSWEPNTFSFPPVYPDIPKLKIACPRQENLRELFKFIIE